VTKATYTAVSAELLSFENNYVKALAKDSNMLRCVRPFGAACEPSVLQDVTSALRFNITSGEDQGCAW
jgi:hypothetical protein